MASNPSPDPAVSDPVVAAHTAHRMSRLGTESAFQVLAKAKKLEAEGHNVIHLEIGEPDFPTPQHIIDAAVDALNNGATHYTPSPGTTECRTAVAKHISKTRNVNVSANNIVVVPGGKPVMFYMMICCLEKGDEVIYPNPGFPIYESMIEFSGAKAVPLKLEESRDFRFSQQQLESLITPRTKMIVINSPQNPTGGILTRQELEWVADIANKHDLLVLSDEIYDLILYDGVKHESIISLPGMIDRTVILAGHSKNYAMTGWRLGYAVAPEKLCEMFAKIMVNSVSCTAAFTQAAGIAALEGPHDETEKMVAAWKERRDYLCDALNELGMRCRRPKGAFYVFPNVADLGYPSAALAEYILNECHVAVLDGACFGRYGDGFLRLSCANSLDNIKEAVSRIKAGIARLSADGMPQKYLDIAREKKAASSATACASDAWHVINPEGSRRVVVTKVLPGDRWQQILISADCRIEICPAKSILTQDEILTAIGDKCDAVIGQLTEKWDAPLYNALAKAGGKVHAQYAVGYDNIDVPSATAAGIKVGNTPGVLTDTTAEMAVALTFSCARNIVEADDFMRHGQYDGWLPDLFLGSLLHRGTLGVVGCGRIGSAYALKMARAEEMDVIYHDTTNNERLETELAEYNKYLVAVGKKPIRVARVPLDEVLKTADIVSIHTALNASTRHLIGSKELEMMKQDSILINTARGPIVDEAALVQHCRSHPSFRAGLDVFEREPFTEPGLDQLNNVIIAPHIASATRFTREGMATLAACNVRGVLEGLDKWTSPDMTSFVKGDLAELPKATPSLVN